MARDGSGGGHRRPCGAVRAAGPPSRSSQFFGRTRELKALRADIERAGLDTLAGRKAAPRPGAAHRRAARLRPHRARRGTRRGRSPTATPTGCCAPGSPSPAARRVPIERAARELLDALGIAAPPGADEDELTETLREALAERRVLLLLDDAGRRRTGRRAAAGHPRLPGRGRLRGPADRHPRRPARAPSAAWTPSPPSNCSARFTGSVRITVDPRAAEALAEECGGPARRAGPGRRLARRPAQGVRRRRGQAAARLPATTSSPRRRPLARAFRLVVRVPAAAAARILRLLAARPGGPGRPAHRLRAGRLLGRAPPAPRWTTSSALGPAARRPTRRCRSTRCPAASQPLLRALLETQDRPAEVQLARARMLERTVRLLQSCRAITETGRLRRPARSWPGCRARCASRPRGPPPSGCASGGPRCWPPPGSRSPTASWTPWPAGWSPRWSGRWSRTAAPRRPPPSCTGCTGWSSTWPSAADLHREQAAALLNLGDLDARTGRTAGGAGPLPGRAGRRTGGERPVRDRPRDGIRRRRLPGAGGLAPGRRLVRPGARPAAGPGRARGRGPAVRPARHRAHLRGPLRRGAAQLAGRRSPATAGSAICPARHGR